MRSIYPVSSVFSARTCISISRQINQISFIIDEKKIYKLSLSRPSGYFGKRSIIGQCVDERRFSYIRSADHREFRKTCLRISILQRRAFLKFGSAFYEHCFTHDHEKKYTIKHSLRIIV